MSEDTTALCDRELSEVRNIIVVAAVQELNAVRRVLDDIGLARKEHFLDNRIVETFRLTNSRGDEIVVGLMFALQKGKSETKSLLETIKSHSSVQHVIMVGMMAGIKGKSKLLDVLSPLTIYDVTSIGTRDSKFVVEPEAGTVDAKLHNLVASIDPINFEDPAIRLTSHKKTVTFSAKIDDLTHDLAVAALNIDQENVVGLEMEGSALIEMQNRNFSLRNIGFLMIKGVADYAGARPDTAEIDTLASIPGIKDHLSDPDPTQSPGLKEVLQREATRRALLVALETLKRLPASST
jgi:nucleoside phosphorylase